MKNTINCQVVMLSTGNLAKKGNLALNKDINDLFIPEIDCFIHKQHNKRLRNRDKDI